MSLRAATQDLHHACEEHALGQKMVNGTIEPQEWADWLQAFMDLHKHVDCAFLHHMRRDWLLEADLKYMAKLFGVVPCKSAAVERAVNGGIGRLGAGYVLHGAHRRGGRVLAPIMTRIGMPTAHTFYGDPKDAENIIKWLAWQDEHVEDAQECFSVLLEVMGEITGR